VSFFLAVIWRKLPQFFSSVILLRKTTNSGGCVVANVSDHPMVSMVFADPMVFIKVAGSWGQRYDHYVFLAILPFFRPKDDDFLLNLCYSNFFLHNQLYFCQL
jgi:hypothetical protein